MGAGASGVGTVRDDRRPTLVRPSVPLIAWVAAGVWAGVLVAEGVVRIRLAAALSGGSAVPGALGGPAASVSVLLACLAMLGLARARGFGRAMSLVALAALAGFLVGLSWWGGWARRVETLACSGKTRWVVEVTGDAVSGRFGASSIARLAGNDLPRELAGASVSVQWPEDVRPPGPGRAIAVTATYVSPLQNLDRLAATMRSGRCGSLRVRRVGPEVRARSLRRLVAPLREWALERTHAVSGAGGALLDGVLLGDRTRLDGTSAEAAFRTTGLTHLVAVSGSHLVVVAALVSGVAGVAGVSRARRVALVAVVTGLYVVLSGVQVSAVRAWVMTVVVLGVGLAGRRTDPLAALGAAAVGMIVLSPPAAFDLGFRLSVASVAGLVLLARLAEEWLGFVMPRPIARLAGPLALTLVAQAATLPMTARVFGAVSLCAPVANLLVGPIVSLALVVSIAGLGAAAVWPFLGRLVLGATGAVLGVGVRVAERLARSPGAAVPAGPEATALATLAFAGAVAAWLAWPRPRNRLRARIGLSTALLVAAVVLVGVPLPRSPSVSVLDVGQGDAILLQGGRGTVLVDAGPAASAMRAAAGRRRIRRIDLLLITHAHDDHTGGLDGLKELVRIKSTGTGVQWREQEERDVDGAGTGRHAAERMAAADVSRLRLHRGDTLSVGGWRLEVLWPPSGGVNSESTNDESLVVLARHGGFSMLLTGDAEANVLERLRREGLLEDVDVVKVPHHGSRDVLSAELLGALKPEVAVVSVGAGNRFGHPDPGTLEILAKAGVRTLRTDKEGDVTFDLDADGYRLRASRGGW